MNSTYYRNMMDMDRLIPLTLDGKICGVITYLLCRSPDAVHGKDPWTIDLSIPEGNEAYIEQLIVKSYMTVQDSLKIFRCLIRIIQEKHPDVSVIFWRRYNQHTHRLDTRVYNLKERSYVYN